MIENNEQTPEQKETQLYEDNIIAEGESEILLKTITAMNNLIGDLLHLHECLIHGWTNAGMYRCYETSAGEHRARVAVRLSQLDLMMPDNTGDVLEVLREMQRSVDRARSEAEDATE